MKVSQEVQAIFNAAYNEAKLRNHEYLTPEHILYASLSFEQVRSILEACEADVEQLRRGMEAYFEQKIPQVKNTEPVQTAGFQSVIERAVLQSQAAGKEEVEVADVLVSLYDEERNYSAYYLRKSGVKRLQLLEVISHGDGSEGELFEEDDEEEEEEEGREEREERKPRASGRMNPLERFASDLTKSAREGKLEPVIGRTAEIERTVQVLCRRLKNNPIHVGDAGVGKTAITEGLAQRIVAGEVPPRLRDYAIYALDMGALLAGTKFRGDFEERVKKVVDELLKKDKSILFIDEIHTHGRSRGGLGRIARRLQPAEACSHLGQAALYRLDDLRRIQQVLREGPGAVSALPKDRHRRADPGRDRRDPQGPPREVRGVPQGPLFRRGPRTRRQTLAQYITERRLPDKAIDVIDEAGAWARMNAYKTGTDSVPVSIDGAEGAASATPAATETATLDISAKEIEVVVAKIARIPERSVSMSEKDKLASLEADLKSDVFGQDRAVESVVKAVKRSRAGFRSPDKPVANFMFVGPTGVGKTGARQAARPAHGHFLAPLRHVRIPGKAHRLPPHRLAARLRGLRGGRPPHRRHT